MEPNRENSETMSKSSLPLITGTETEQHQQDSPEFRSSTSSSDTLSPRRERRHSTGSSSSDGSVAINVPAMPTKVVVKGHRVQTVRVEFPTQSSASRKSSSTERRAHSSRKLPPLSRAESGRRSTKYPSLSVREVSDDVGLPTQETLSEDNDRSSIPRIHSIPHIINPTDRELPRVTSHPEPLSSGTGYPVNFTTRQLSSHPAVYVSDDCELNDSEEERKVTQDIVNLLEFLDRRNQNLRATNARLMSQLEALNRENERMRNLIQEAEKRLTLSDEENEELKLQVDQLKKENTILNEKNLSEWNSRVSAEELYMEEKRRGDEEIKSLKDEIERKNAEIKQMESQIHNVNSINEGTENGSGVNGTRNRSSVTKSADDDIHKLLLRLSELESSIAAVKADRNRFASEVNHLHSESNSWRARFEAKNREYDVLSVQYNTLQVNFKHMEADNRKLRSQYTQVRKSSLDAGFVSMGNGGTSLTLSTGSKQDQRTSFPQASSTSVQQPHVLQMPTAVSSGPAPNTKINKPGSRDSTLAVTTTPVIMNRPAANQQHFQQQRRRISNESSSGLSSSSIDLLPSVQLAQNQTAISKVTK